MPPSPAVAMQHGAAPPADGRHANDRSIKPSVGKHAQPPGRASFGAEGTEQPHDAPASSEEAGGADADLVAAISALAQEIGDDAPLASSLARARGIFQGTGLPLDVFLERLDEAAERTRAHHTTIVARRRDGHASNGMPYLFAVLERLPDTPATDPRPFYPRQPRRVWRASRSEGASSTKYIGGSYGVCVHCLCSPCDPECITRQETATPRADSEGDTSSRVPGGGETSS